MAFQVVLVSALLLLSSFGVDAGKKVTVVEDTNSGIVTRFDKKGDSVSNAIHPGDTYLWDAPLLNPSSKKQVGTISGNLLYSSEGKSIATYTAELDGAQSITVSGVYRDSMSTQLHSITGGTGSFSAARGTVKVTAGVTGDKYEFNIL